AFQCDAPEQPTCTPTATTCAGLGWACGTAIDNCGNTYNCANEGRTCGALETCVGGIGAPTTCMGSGGGSCPLCGSVPVCTGGTETRLTGRVITPGRDNGNTANQVGVPNAFVYILRTNNIADLPAISSGIPTGGESCDRCDEQNLGSVLTGAVSDATGAFTLEGNIPVGAEFILVTKVGKFRRAVQMTLQAGAACTTTALTSSGDANPTRLPRAMTGDGGLGINIPRVAISTGQIDAMECVLWKMGLSTSEFVNGSGTTTGGRLHVYRGGANSGSPPGAGARIDNNTPHDSTLYGSLSRMQTYDMVVADCEGQSWDGSFTQRDADGQRVREYVNRGGRMFASHLSFSWLHQNGTQAYVPDGTRFQTGLGPAASWQATARIGNNVVSTAAVALNRPNASPRIDNFAAWLVREGVTTSPNYTFSITDLISQATSLGASSEEFVHCTGGGDCIGGNVRTQQFSFNTPYAAPTAAACGRLAYSGFHVAAGGAAVAANAMFPALCQGASANNGNLTNQEKVLLYMLFDLGACVGDEPDPPTCTPQACPAYPACGTQGNGCGGTQQCGCPSDEACIAGECQPQGCVPTTCEAEGVTCANISDGCGRVLPCDCPGCDRLGCEDAGAECGLIGDGCGGEVDCGPCEMGQVCTRVGGQANRCFGCEPRTCGDADAECGYIGDGCGGAIDCGPCEPGEICGAVSPNQCDGGNSCNPLTCEAAGAECGLIGDGCGGQRDCGPCPLGEVCGIDDPFKCGPPPPCDPSACDDDSCGYVGDGCGDVVNCGECEPGETCGLYEPNKCDTVK
ncbi:MAG TPA: hypothetical protein VGK73_24315, partial [Polyangiaceae bacterium]